MARMPNPDGGKAKSITILSNLNGDSLLNGDWSLTEMTPVSVSQIRWWMTTDELDGDVAPVWTQRTADSNYSVILDTVEGVIENGVNKKSVNPAFFLE
jgi:hypothetical protein